MPTVSTNTAGRSKISASTVSLLGDNKIPAPDFTGEPRSSIGSNNNTVVESNNIDEQIRQAEIKYRQTTDRYEAARIQLREQRNSLLPGDPGLNRVEQQYIQASDVWIADRRTLRELRNKKTQLENQAILDRAKRF